MRLEFCPSRRSEPFAGIQIESNTVRAEASDALSIENAAAGESRWSSDLQAKRDPPPPVIVDVIPSGHFCI